MKPCNGISQGRRRERGFTLIEVIIVVGIVALVASIAIPYFVAYRSAAQTKACVANLRQLTAAKEQYALENKKTTGDPCDYSDLIGTDKYLKNTIVCPAGGGASYSVGNIGDDPACPTSLTDHVLP